MGGGKPNALASNYKIYQTFLNPVQQSFITYELKK
jgi:hypothetical protein